MQACPTTILEDEIKYRRDRQTIRRVATEWSGRIGMSELADLDVLVPMGLLSRVDLDAMKAFLAARSAHLVDLVDGVLTRNPPEG